MGKLENLMFTPLWSWGIVGKKEVRVRTEMSHQVSHL
jgi:hypothetical protein